MSNIRTFSSPRTVLKLSAVSKEFGWFGSSDLSKEFGRFQKVRVV